MADFRGNDEAALRAAVERLAAGSAIAHSPSRQGVLVMVGDDRAVLVSFAAGRLRVKAFAPRDVPIEFLEPREERPAWPPRK